MRQPKAVRARERLQRVLVEKLFLRASAQFLGGRVDRTLRLEESRGTADIVSLLMTLPPRAPLAADTKPARKRVWLSVGFRVAAAYSA